MLCRLDPEVDCITKPSEGLMECKNIWISDKRSDFIVKSFVIFVIDIDANKPAMILEACLTAPGELTARSNCNDLALCGFALFGVLYSSIGYYFILPMAIFDKV